MDLLYLLILYVAGFLLGYFSKNKKSSNTTKLSDSLAKLVYASTQSTKENYEDSSVDKSIDEISKLISEGNIEQVEKIITTQDNNIDNIVSEINNTAEILKPELVTDSEVKEAVDYVVLEGEVNKVQDELELKIEVSDIIKTTDGITPTEIENISKEITEINNKLIDLNNKLSKKVPLETAILKINDPEKLAHLQEIQAKILAKREKQKKKRDEKIKNENPKIKEKINIKIQEKKKQDLDEKKTKIKDKK